jgi:hypothetical protein
MLNDFGWLWMSYKEIRKKLEEMATQRADNLRRAVSAIGFIVLLAAKLRWTHEI